LNEKSCGRDALQNRRDRPFIDAIFETPAAVHRVAFVSLVRSTTEDA
jgi:hypothetical protein